MTKSCLVIGDLNIDFVLNELKGFPELGREIVARNHFIDIGGSGGIFSTFFIRTRYKHPYHFQNQ